MMLDFCVKTAGIQMHKLFDAIEMINGESKPTLEQIKYCEQQGWANFDVSTTQYDDWYCLLRESQGDLSKLKKEVQAGGAAYMLDGTEFIQDSLFCEYAYIIDLDTEMLEFWVGFQKKPTKGNRYGEKPDENGYYPCKHLLYIPLSDITPETVDEKIGLMDTYAEKYEQWQEKGVIFPIATQKPEDIEDLIIAIGKRKKEKYIEVCEDLGWWVKDYGDDIEIGQASSAGEDFFFTIPGKDIPQEVAEYASKFDADEHAEMWLQAKTNGTKGVPSVRELINDADDIQEALDELARALLEVKIN